MSERALSRDRPADGLVVYQPARGFRYAMEPFLLAGWVLERHGRGPFLDVGTGSGILALLLARQGLGGEGIDVVPEWIALARRSAAESGLSVDFHVQDVRRRAAPPVDLAVMNPPFFDAGTGPLPRDPLRAAGRHALAGTLAELVAATARAAKTVAVVVPARLGDTVAQALARAGRPVLRRCEVEPAFTLLEGGGEEGGTCLERVPLVEAGLPSQRVAGWYRALGARPKPTR